MVSITATHLNHVTWSLESLLTYGGNASGFFHHVVGQVLRNFRYVISLSVFLFILVTTAQTSLVRFRTSVQWVDKSVQLIIVAAASVRRASKWLYDNDEAMCLRFDQPLSMVITSGA